MEHVYNLSGVIAINAGFGFAADVCAQFLEGHRCCLPDSAVGDDDDAAERASATPEFATGDTLEGEEGGDRSSLLRENRAAAAAAASLTVATHGDDVIEIQEDEGGERVVHAPWDWRRTGIFTTTGVLICGVSQFIRLTVIQEMFGGMEATTMLAVEKTAVNQLIFSPVVRVGAMALLHYSKTGEVATIPAKLKKDFWEAQGISWGIKPASNLIGFLVFPHSIVGQAVVLRAAAFGYNVYFSYVSHRDIEEERVAHVADFVDEADPVPGESVKSVDGEGTGGDTVQDGELPVKENTGDAETPTAMAALSHGVAAPISCA